MSSSVSVDYAVILIWLAIFSLYTTLLTVTALSVAWILRKRRSSILKSQRPARTPFSEFEFNVTTPINTAKSRRVSFSRKTGFAEFVTNEATTNWKNVYEEQNKSVESSNNESEVNASRQSIDHLGKRTIDQQLEEVKAVDFINGLANGSLNNVNFSQQLASLECTADGKLTAPQNKFELSAFTEQSKLFGNDFTAPSIGDNSEEIDVNNSAIQKVEKDDLDEKQKDLERGPSNIDGHGPSSAGQNISEYINDLNTTHIVRNDEGMSVTDIVHSPVQDVSKSASRDKKASLNNDWATDKENIAINPYAAPCETNFAINEEPDQVLVFDRKRLVLQPDIPEKDKNYSSTETPQRKTIVLNVNDDLPNFIADNNMLSSKYENSGFKENLETHNIRKTIVFNSDENNVAVTQALSSNILDDKASERKTLVFDYGACNVSYTEALPGNIMLPDKQTQEKLNNITVTQALLSNIIMEIVNLDDTIKNKQAEDVILTNQSLPSNISAKDSATSKRRTIVFANNTGDISIIQAIPTQFIPGYSEEEPIYDLNTSRKPEPRNKQITTIVYDKDEVSMTEAVSANIIKQATNERNMIVYDNNEVYISMTETISANIIEQATNERKTIVDDDDEANISMTLAISANDYLLDKLDSTADIEKPEEMEDEKVKVTDYEDANNLVSETSMTTAIPTVQKLLEIENRDTLLFDSHNYDISTGKLIPADFISETTLDVAAQNQAARRQSNIIVMQASTTNSKQPLNVNAEKAYDSKVELPMKQRSVSSHVTPDKVQVKLIAPSTDQDIEKSIDFNDEAAMQTEEEKKALIIVSNSTIDCQDDKSLMAVLESNSSSGDKLMYAVDPKSTESMFYITKDCEAVIQTDKNEDSDSQTKIAKPKNKEDVLEKVSHIHRKREELFTNVSLNSKLSNRSLNVFERDQYVRRISFTSNRANDTQHLLDLISNFTGNADSEEDINLIDGNVKNLKEHNQLSVAPARHSLVLSKEDLLNNISIPQAALQKSRLALDDSDSADEDASDAVVDLSKISGPTNYEVVKTLNFDDESISDTSLEEKYSLLKKIAFGETEYTKESKGKVIPTYLKAVSDGLKELMLDLVKPVSDNMPFQSGGHERGLSENMSTHSTQVQANLTASSQIDLGNDLISNTGADWDKTSSSGTLDQPEKSKSRAVKFACMDEREMPEGRHIHSSSNHNFNMQSTGHIEQPLSSEVLVFDHLNPLNNILLAPSNLTDVHRYNPRLTEDMSCSSKSHLNNTSNYNNNEVETMANMQCRGLGTGKKQEKIFVYQNDEQYCLKDDQHMIQSTSTTSGRTSVDQSVDAILKNLIDDEVNTLIAMRGNKELLQTSSSLTLVDDLSEGENSKMTGNNEDYSNHRIQFSRSPPVYIEDHAVEVDYRTEYSGISLRDCVDNSCLKACATKGKKRIYSPSTHKHKPDAPSKEVTPKPIPKMQKTSRNPKPHKEAVKMSSRNDSSLYSQSNSQNVHKPKIREKKTPKAKNTKSGHTITVQQLITGYQCFDSEFKHKNNSEKKLDDLNLNQKSETISDASFASSKNMNSMKEDISTGMSTGFETPHEVLVQPTRSPSQMNWHPEPLGTSSTNQSEPDSGVNVVAKIDMLPFMGSHECEWDSKSLADTWSFRLQHGRLRLTVQLAHRHDNATRTRVRGDTSVLDIAVETVQQDPKYPVAMLCVRFACDTMRYIVSHALHTPCCARDIPQLLRRCAAIARVALRWGRAMHDAKLQLAYTLENDGNLSLKVANVQLRSVWEVMMHIELVVDDSRSVPWPKADSVRVTRVVSELLVPDEDVRRVLSNMPRDWGHAPRTIWRMFRYLKHKTRDDNAILA